MIQGGGIPRNAQITQGFRIVETQAGTRAPPQDAHQAGALFHNHRVPGPQARRMADGATRLKECFSTARIPRRLILGRRRIRQVCLKPTREKMIASRSYFNRFSFLSEILVDANEWTCLMSVSFVIYSCPHDSGLRRGRRRRRLITVAWCFRRSGANVVDFCEAY